MVDADSVLVEQFGTLVQQFLDASLEVWKDDSVLLSYKVEFDETRIRFLLSEFLSLFGPFSQRLDAKDESLFDEETLQKFLGPLNAKEKYAGANLDTRTSIWEYVRQINQSATIKDVYSKCPEEMMSKVASLANSIVGEMNSGTLDISKLNPMELSMKLMQDLDPKMVEGWANSLMTGNSMENMMRVMQSAMSGAGVAGLPFDPTALQGMGLDPSILKMLDKKK